MYMFGVGRLFGVGSDGTPVEFATLQGVSLDISVDKKELHGSQRFPVAIALGKGKIEGKAQSARILAAGLAFLAGAAAPAVGQRLFVEENGAIPDAPGPYTIATTHAGADFYKDLGVWDTTVSPAVPMKKVAGAPAAINEYSVTTGTYTFHSTAKLKTVKIDYLYTVAGSGKLITLAQADMDEATYFSAFLSTKMSGKQLNCWLDRVVSSKLSMAWKNEDFMIPDFDLSAGALADGSVGWMSVGE